MVKKSTKKRSPKKIKIVEHHRASDREFTNREIGWLHFNRRVLAEAEDSHNPLLERVKFLSISVSNLDEFFMKRVGGLKRHIAYGVSQKSSDGKTPEQQMKLVRDFVVPMVKDQTKCFADLKSELHKAHIHILKWEDLKEKEREFVKSYYAKNVFPVLTPLSVDPGHPFPFISNLSTSLGIALKHPNSEDKLFARIKVPRVLPQWIRVDSGKEERLISLIEVMKYNVAELFPDMQVLQVMPFRITRNADSDSDQEDTEDLLQMIEEELRQRRFAEVVRMEIGARPDEWLLELLTRELNITKDDIYEIASEFELMDLAGIVELPHPHLKFESHNPLVPQPLLDENQNIFDVLRSGDLLLHHPFESFVQSVERFIRTASDDPKVLAIKMTLYRTGDNSSFVQSLIRAAEIGKQVVCLIELKARFDEERNIIWAQALENAGVHVVYGIVGLKTHAKTALVVRQETDGLRCYAHIGTGNYNSVTARFYTDVGLLTAREEITSELVSFFNYLTGRSLKNEYKHLLVAPVNMFLQFKRMIEREGDNAEKGLPSQIIAKFNNMEENDLAVALYAASQKKVSIDLIVRGFCCVKPGLAGLSENIRVKSVVGRFLEHSRIFYFRNAAVDPIDGDFYIGSADWMYRNLHSRVEAIVPILDRTLREKLWDILQAYLKDQGQSWIMKTDGNYERAQSKELSKESGVQEYLIVQTRNRAMSSTEGGS